MSEILQLALAGATFVAVVLSLIGLGVKYALLPWLLQHVVAPVKETNRQVTVNKHVSDPPTLLDKVDQLATDVEALDVGQKAAAGMFEGHIENSATEWGHLWSAIDALRHHTGAPPYERKHHHD